MPLASLSTFAVMKPGPTTAKNSRKRVFQRLSNFMGRHKHQRRLRINADGKTEQGQTAHGLVGRVNRRTTCELLLLDQVGVAGDTLPFVIVVCPHIGEAAPVLEWPALVCALGVVGSG